MTHPCPHCLHQEPPKDLTCAFCLGDVCECDDCVDGAPVQRSAWATPMRLMTRTAILDALRIWAAGRDLGWDEDHSLPEPLCQSCQAPINVHDGEEACMDCDSCQTCCWDNHGGEPHTPGVCA